MLINVAFCGFQSKHVAFYIYVSVNTIKVSGVKHNIQRHRISLYRQKHFFCFRKETNTNIMLMEFSECEQSLYDMIVELE